MKKLPYSASLTSLIICALVFVAGWWRGEGSILEQFMTSISLAIAAVPEGLPAIVTINLALGMREMICRQAGIRKLSSFTKDSRNYSRVFCI